MKEGRKKSKKQKKSGAVHRRAGAARIAALVFLLAGLTGTLLFAAGQGETGAADEKGSNSKPLVYVSILPQKYFVERIAGELVEVHVLVPPGKSPATYEPTPTQVTRLGEASLFFSIGVPFERRFVPTLKSSLADLTIVPTQAPIDRKSIHAHTHDSDGEEGGMPDPHIWMSPKLVKIQSGVIKDALSKQFPQHSAAFQENYFAFKEDLTELQEYLNEVLSPHRGETLFVYHPAFGYFADEFGLHQVAIETGGKEPTPKQLEEIIHHAKEEGVKVIFVQPEFPKASAEAVAKAIGGAVVPVATLAPNYLDNLKRLARKIDEALSEK